MFVVCNTFFGKKKLVEKDKLIKRPSAYGFAIHQGSILLVNNKSTNKLFFPGGGIDPDESKEDALKREFLEETMIEIDIIEYAGVAHNYHYYEPTETPYEVTGYFYFVKPLSLLASGDNNPALDDEAEKPKWYQIDKLKYDDFQDWGGAVFEKFVLPAHPQNI